MNDTLAWDINRNGDAAGCIDIDPETLYALESTEERLAELSDVNPRIIKLCDRFLGEPNGHLSHRLPHTSHAVREGFNAIE